MVGLADIAPATAKVDCGGERPVEVRGVSIRGASNLMERFPELQKFFRGMAVSPDELIKIAPDAVAAIIAAGVGKPDDMETEAVADVLPLDAQIDLLEAILRLTMPRGVGPFAEKLMRLMGQRAAEASASVPATTSASRSKR
jgi:hypothetical protein